MLLVRTIVFHDSSNEIILVYVVVVQSQHVDAQNEANRVLFSLDVETVTVRQLHLMLCADACGVFEPSCDGSVAGLMTTS